MEKRDLNQYIRAKRQTKISAHVIVAAIVIIGIYVVLSIMNAEIPHLEYVAIGVLIGCIAANIDAGWSIVSKRELLGIIERQIQKDPDALMYLNEKR